MKRDSEKILLPDGSEREEKESALMGNMQRDVALRKEPSPE